MTSAVPRKAYVEDVTREIYRDYPDILNALEL